MDNWPDVIEIVAICATIIAVVWIRNRD